MNTTENTYQQQAIDFLNKTKTKLSVIFDRFDSMTWDKDGQKRNIFKCTLSNEKGSYTFDFGSSIQDSCKPTPIINSNEKCEIYCVWSFGRENKVYFSHRIKTDYPTLRRIEAGELKSFDLIGNFKEDYQILKDKMKELKKNLPSGFKNANEVFSSIDQKINKFISEAHEETILLDQADEIVKPTEYDILTCLTKYDPGTFENFCYEFGYDTDSRKAEKTYNAVREEYLQLSRLFNEDELTEMQEIQ